MNKPLKTALAEMTQDIFLLFEGAANLFIEAMQKFAGTRRTGPTSEIVKPLKLDLQFFADPDEDPDEEPEDKKKEEDTKKKEDPEKDTDPAGQQQEEEPSLTELFKKHPKLKTQYSEKFQKDFNKRLKGMNLEEARKAVELLEKLGLTPDGKEDANASSQQQAAAPAPKLETKMKDLSFKVYVADKGFDTALITELGKSKVRELELNDDGDLDPEELEEIIEDLQERFPQAFVEKQNADKSKETDSSYTPGGRQKTNPPPKPKDIADKTKERFERLTKNKKI